MTPSTVPLVVALQPAGSLQPCVLKPTELETDGNAAEGRGEVTREPDNRGCGAKPGGWWRLVLCPGEGGVGTSVGTLTGFSSEANAGVGGAVQLRVAEAEAHQAVLALVARQRVDWKTEEGGVNVPASVQRLSSTALFLRDLKEMSRDPF